MIYKVNLNTLILAAFRYALGRKTYIVEEVVEDIIHNIDNIPDTYLKRMYEEIDEAISNNRAGMKMDIVLWKKLQEKIIGVSLLKDQEEKYKFVLNKVEKGLYRKGKLEYIFNNKDMK